MDATEAERKRARALYGSDEPVDSFITSLGFRIENTTLSRIRAMYPDEPRGGGGGLPGIPGRLRQGLLRLGGPRGGGGGRRARSPPSPADRPPSCPQDEKASD